VTTLRG